MEGNLENHEADPFPYRIAGADAFIATRKNNKTYLHFYQGISSSAINFFSIPGAPRAVRLLNDGRALPVRFEKLPAYFDMGVARGPFYSITHIPADEFPLEPMVIEITW